MSIETPANAALVMDRGLPLGNSEDIDSRRALHVKIKNLSSEPIGNISADVTFVRDGMDQKVIEDTAVSANDRPLPTKTPDSFTSTTTLGALNDAVIVPLEGLTSVGFQINAGTLVGTIQAQSSLDGGISWKNVPFYDPDNSAILRGFTFSSPNTLQQFSVIPLGGSSHVKVFVSAYTSGSATSLLRASNVVSASGSITAAAFAVVTNTYPTLAADTITLILAANPNRKYALISNGSGATIRLQLGSGAGLSATTGRVVKQDDDVEIVGSNLFTGNLYAFSGSGGTISVSEGTP